MSALDDPQTSLRAKIDAQFRKHDWENEEQAQEIFLVDIWPRLENDYETMVEKMKTKYDKLLKTERIDGMVEGRVKSRESIRQSMHRRRKQREHWESFREMMDEIHDLAAIRIIVDYPHHLTKISHSITNSKTLCPRATPNIFLADRPVGTYWAAWFGAYECENHHVEAHYPDDDPARWYNEVIFEIQITCLPAHLHNKIAHSLHYKGQGGELSRGDEIVIDLTRGLGLCYSLCLYYKSEKLLSDRDQLMNEPVSHFDRQLPGTGFGAIPMKFPNIPGLNDPNIKELPSQFFQEAIKNSSAISGQETSVTIWDSLVSELSRAITNRQAQPRIPSTEEQQLIDRVISKLPFERMGDREGNIENALESTCSWLLDNPMYQDWKTANANTETRPFFWIKGKAGSGKSVMMKFLTENMKETSQEDNVISFFFSARGEERTTKELYRSILHDLFWSEPDLQKNIDSLKPQDLRRIDQSGWEIKDLKRVISRSLANRQARGRLYLLIDALDECHEDEIREMLKFFETQKLDAFRMCLASRPYPEISLADCHHLVLEDHTAEDIRAYIHDRLKIFDISEVDAQSVKDAILKRCSGIFLWVILVIPLLQKRTDRGDGDSVISLMETLKQTPNGLNELFQDMIQRDEQSLPTVCLTLQWILFARRPLHPQELRTAVRSSQSKDPQTGNPETLRKFVLDTTRGLAEITKSSPPTVQFIHESVREFLLSNHHRYTQGLEGNFEGQSHSILAHACLLQFQAPPQTVTNSANPPLLEYAMDCIFYHANLAQHFGVRQDKFLLEFPLQFWIEKADCPPDTTLLYILAEQGAEHLISIHPDRARHLRLKGGAHSYPFFAALLREAGLNGFRSIDALFGFGPSFESDLKEYYIYLIQSLFSRHIVLSNDESCCPIMFFLRSASYPLLHRILDSHQYEIPCSKHGLYTGLFIREIPQEEILDLCFEFAPNLNFLGQHLRFNAAGDRSPTPKKLKGSSLQVPDDDGGRSGWIDTDGPATRENREPGLLGNLRQSVTSSYNSWRRIFLGRSALPINPFQRRMPKVKGFEHFQQVVDHFPEILYTHLEPNVTLLDLAIEKEFSAVIPLIISMIINRKNYRGAMSAATSAVSARRTLGFESRSNIIRQLVDASFKLDLQILLHHATQPLLKPKKMKMDDWRMMEFLVHGFKVVELDPKVGEGQRLFNEPVNAQEARQSGTVAQLMKYGVNLYDVDGKGSTILHKLTDTEQLSYILSTGDINIDAKDRRGSTAILLAAKVESFNRVALFLDAGADINVIDHYGSTLLHYCVRNEEIIGRILEKSRVNVNAENQLGYTSLYTAIKAEAYGTVKRLLNAGACPDIEDLLLAIKVEAYGCIDALLGATGYSNKTELLRYSVAKEHERMFDLLLASNALAEPKAEDWDKLLKTVVNQGKLWFVKRIVNHHKIMIDPAWLGPLVSKVPGGYRFDYHDSCETLRQCLNEMKASMNGKLPKANRMPLQLAIKHNRYDMVFLMEAFLRDEPLMKVITKEERNKLITNSRRMIVTT
jgi:ppGpp synthetase/RelA/SpoT-type nucleotidyltranferase